jgi:hypothetical protein
MQKGIAAVEAAMTDELSDTSAQHCSVLCRASDLSSARGC